MTGPSITIAVATMGERIGHLHLLPPVGGVGYLVVHQDSAGSGAAEARGLFLASIAGRDDVEVVTLPGVGLSASRNTALQRATGSWILIADDDIAVDTERLREVVDSAERGGHDVVTVAHSFADGSDTRGRLGSGPHSLRTIGTPASVDLILRAAAIRAHGLRFDERFGLGTRWPSGEEAIFLADCLRAGLDVERMPVVVTTHPDLSSGFDFFSTPARVAAKREMLRRIFPRRGYLAAVAWWARKLPEARRGGHPAAFSAGMLAPRRLLPMSAAQEPGAEQHVILSGVRSVTHLVYAASWLDRAARQRAVRVTVLDPGSFLGASRVTSRDIERVLAPHPTFLVPQDADVGADLSDGAVLLCIGAPSLRAVAATLRRSGRLPEVVVVDEGLGSYGDRHTQWRALRREGTRVLPAWGRATARAVLAGVLTTERWPMYVRARGSWEVAPAVASAFDARVSGEPPRPGTAVYLSQPWPELGIMTEAEYLDHLRETAEAVAAHGLSLAVHPHPTENSTRYADAHPVIRTGPAELDRAVREADLLLGANSSALLNTTALTGRPGMRVTHPAWAVLESGLGDVQRSLLDAFLPSPVTAGELRKRLKSR